MEFFFFSFTLTASLILSCLASTADCIYYTAGVVEFAAAVRQGTETPRELILKNTQQYLQIIETAAKHSVDILVFPECGLTSLNIPVQRSLIVPYATEMPAVDAKPCDLPDVPQVLKTLSCAARTNNIYVVVNLDELAHCQTGQDGCPADGFLFYNTNLAFDRNGTIVAKYRKHNLFIEPEFNATKTPGHSWFETNFGVKFGMFICFDMMFKEPSFGLLSKFNISNFVYSTAWFSELPFFSATSIQAAWAYNHDVNLLASGYSNTSNKNAGSGIYAGRDGTQIAIMPQHSTTKLLIARVSTDQRGVTPKQTEEITFTEDHDSQLKFFHDDITRYENVIISEKKSSINYENDGFQCNVTAKVSSLSDGEVYRLVAYRGERTFGGIRKTHFEVCGVVACSDENLSSCSQKPFSSKTVFETISLTVSSENESQSFPITMKSSLLPLSSKSYKFDKIKSGKSVTLSMDLKTPQTGLLTFAMYRKGDDDI